MNISLGQVRLASYWCTRHNCALEPNSNKWMDPAATVEAIREKLGPLASDSEVDVIRRVLERTGHTACTQSPAARIWPDFMLGEMYFTCPVAEADFAFGEAEYVADPQAAFSEAIEKDWPYWIMRIGDSDGTRKGS